MRTCTLSLSVAANGARDSLADLLRDHRLPSRPIAVKKDGERLRGYWKVDVRDDMLDLDPVCILPAEIRAVGARSFAEYCGYSIAPVVFNLFRDSAFDRRWTLRPDASGLGRERL